MKHRFLRFAALLGLAAPLFAAERPNVDIANAPLRGEKGTRYEGGVRIPAIARWPGHVPADRESAARAIPMDVYPTLLELAGKQNRKSRTP
jgi:arylsulfatase A-like enzyme